MPTKKRGRKAPAKAKRKKPAFKYPELTLEIDDGPTFEDSRGGSAEVVLVVGHKREEGVFFSDGVLCVDGLFDAGFIKGQRFKLVRIGKLAPPPKRQEED